MTGRSRFRTSAACIIAIVARLKRLPWLACARDPLLMHAPPSGNRQLSRRDTLLLQAQVNLSITAQTYSPFGVPSTTPDGVFRNYSPGLSMSEGKLLRNLDQQRLAFRAWGKALV